MKHFLSSKAVYESYLAMTAQTQLIHINYFWLCVILPYSSARIIYKSKKDINPQTNHTYERKQLQQMSHF